MHSGMIGRCGGRVVCMVVGVVVGVVGSLG